ncbi:MAG: YpdA family putative bacillithiol disulfide reductase [Bacteroidales bacterium]
MSLHDVIIVGAGPVGLAAAIAAKARGLDYVVLEKGALVNSIYHFPTNMVFFTTPELLEIGGLPLVSPFEKPTRLEALRYYRRVADTFKLKIEMDVRVCAVRTEPDAESERFAVDTERADGTRGVRCARAVVLAIGYYDHPNMLGIPGEDLPHVAHYYREAHPFYRKRVVVVGGANSAAEAALELHRAGAHVTLVHRRETFNKNMKYWVLPDLQNRIKDGAFPAFLGYQVVEIQRHCVVIRRDGDTEEIPADAVFVLTGYRTDVGLLRSAGVHIDPCTAMPEHDPETFETNVRNLFVAGGTISGDNAVPIFIENGRFHGEKVVSEIARRLGKADG